MTKIREEAIVNCHERDGTIVTDTALCSLRIAFNVVLRERRKRKRKKLLS